MDYDQIYQQLVSSGILQDSPGTFDKFKQRMESDPDYNGQIMAVYGEITQGQQQDQSAQAPYTPSLPTPNYNQELGQYEQMVETYNATSTDYNDYMELYQNAVNTGNNDMATQYKELMDTMFPELQGQRDLIDQKREMLVELSKAGSRRQIVNPDQWEGYDFSEEAEGDFLKGRWAWVNKLGWVGEWIDDFAMNWHSGAVTARSVDDAMKALRRGANLSEEDLTNLVEAWDAQHTVQQSNEVLKYHRDVENCGNTLLCALGSFIKNPRVAPLVMASSLRMMWNPNSRKAGLATLGASTVAGAGIGATGFLAGPTGIATTGGGAVAGFSQGVPLAFASAGGVMETAISFAEFINEELDGKPFNNENVRAILEDPEKLRRIKNRAIKRGTTIGVVDAITGTLARNVGMSVMRRGAPTVTRRGGVALGQVGGEMLGGSTGEYLGQKAGDQEINWSEIALEGLAEGPMATFDFLSMAKPPSYKVRGQNATRAEMTDIIENSPLEDLLDMEIKINGDPQLEEQYNEQVKKATTEKLIRQASPTAKYSRQDLDRLIEIQRGINDLSDNKSLEADEKRKALKAEYRQIKAKYDAQEQGTVQEAEGGEAGTSGEVAESDTKLRELTGEATPEDGVTDQVDSTNAEIVAGSIYGESAQKTDVPGTVVAQAEDHSVTLRQDGETLIIESVDVSDTARSAEVYSNAIEQVLEKADNFGIPVVTQATPENQQALESMGFEQRPDGTMFRAPQDRLVTRPTESEVGMTLNEYLKGKQMVTPDATPENVTVNGEAVSGDYVLRANDKVDMTKAMVEEDTALVMKDIEATLAMEQAESGRRSLHRRGRGRRMPQELRVRTLEQAMKNALRAVKTIVPNLRYKIVTDPDQWGRISGDSIEEGFSRGLFSKDGVIYLNASNPNDFYNATVRDVAHETFHAVLKSIFKTDARIMKATQAMISKLIPHMNPEIADYLEDFTDQYEAGEVSEEKVVEFFGVIAEEIARRDANKTVIDIVRDWIKAIADFIGVNPPRSDEELIDLMMKLAGKVARGQEISAEELSTIEQYADQASAEVQSTAPTDKKSKVRPIRTPLSDYLSTIDSEMAFDLQDPDIQAGIKEAEKLNGGHPMSKTPKGENSWLHATLMGLPEVNSNALKADVLKAKVYSPEFRRWFGDWLSAMKYGIPVSEYPMSQVVDYNGEPLLLFHGSQDMLAFDAFRKSQDGGFHFSTLLETAQTFAPQIRKLKYGPNIDHNPFENSAVGGFYLRLTKVYDIYDMGGWNLSKFEEIVKRLGLEQHEGKYNLNRDYLSYRDELDGIYHSDQNGIWENYRERPKDDMPTFENWLYDLGTGYLDKWDILRQVAVRYFGQQDFGKLMWEHHGFRYVNKLEGPRSSQNKAYIVLDPANIKSVHNNGEFGIKEQKFKRSRVYEGYDSDMTAQARPEMDKQAVNKVIDAIRKGALLFSPEYATRMIRESDYGEIEVGSPEDQYYFTIPQPPYGQIRNFGKRDEWLIEEKDFPPGIVEKARANFESARPALGQLNEVASEKLFRMYLTGLVIDPAPEKTVLVEGVPVKINPVLLRTEIFDEAIDMPPVMTEGVGYMSDALTTETATDIKTYATSMTAEQVEEINPSGYEELRRDVLKGLTLRMNGVRVEQEGFDFFVSVPPDNTPRKISYDHILKTLKNLKGIEETDPIPEGDFENYWKVYVIGTLFDVDGDVASLKKNLDPTPVKRMGWGDLASAESIMTANKIVPPGTVIADARTGETYLAEGAQSIPGQALAVDMTDTSAGEPQAQTHTGVKKSRVSVDPKKRTALMAVDAEVLSTEGANLDGFTPKSEYHVTLIGFGLGRLINNIIAEKPEVEQKISDLLETTEFAVIPTAKLYRVEKDYLENKWQSAHTRESIVELVDVPGINEFYDKLSEILGVDLIKPMPHVTLTVKGNPMGIGINSEKEFNELSTPINETEEFSQRDQEADTGTRAESVGPASSRSVVSEEDVSARGIRRRDQRGTRKLGNADVAVDGTIALDERVSNAIQRNVPNAVVVDELLDVSQENQWYADNLQNHHETHPYGSSVTPFSAEELQPMRLYTTPSGRAGMAITPNNEIVGVWSREKGVIPQMLVTALKLGVDKIDAFDTILTNLYSMYGFKPTSRVLFDDEQAPANWDYELYKDFNDGRPDYVFMIYDGGPVETIEDRIYSDEFQLYKDYDIENEVPITDYNTAIQLRNERAHGTKKSKVYQESDIQKKSRVRGVDGKASIVEESKLAPLDTGIETTSWQMAGRIIEADITNLKRAINNGLGREELLMYEEAQLLDSMEFNLFPQQDVDAVQLTAPVVLVEMAGHPQYDSIVHALEAISDPTDGNPYAKLSDVYMVVDGRHKLKKFLQQGREDTDWFVADTDMGRVEYVAEFWTEEKIRRDLRKSGRKVGSVQRRTRRTDKTLSAVILSQKEFEATTGQLLLSEDMYRMMDDLGVADVEEAVEVLREQESIPEHRRIEQFGENALSDVDIDFYWMDIRVEDMIRNENYLIDMKTRRSEGYRKSKVSFEDISRKVGDLNNTINSTASFASASSIPTNLEFKKKLDKRWLDDFQKLKKRYEIKRHFRTRRDEFPPEMEAYLLDAYTYEALTAIKNFPEALGWYDIKIKVAMAVLSRIHPELNPNDSRYDADSEILMKIALAVTSNGLAVNVNALEADRVYRYKKQNGHFDTSKSVGLAGPAIRETFKFVNRVLESMSAKKFHEFLVSEFTAKELQYRDSKGALKNLATGVSVKDKVFGASIFGPKIGGGYYMNLSGNFDIPTQDRWFFRQFARLTGMLIQRNIPLIKENMKRLRGHMSMLSPKNLALAKKQALALEKAGKTEELAELRAKIDDAEKTIRLLESEEVNVAMKGKPPKWQIGLMPNWRKFDLGTKSGLYKFALAIEKLSANASVRKKYMGGPFSNGATKLATEQLNEIRKASLTFAGNERGEVEAPTAKQRKFMESLLVKVQARLRDDHNVEISIADLQAVMWFPEKALYETFQEGKSEVTGQKSIVEDERPDYEFASINLARTVAWEAWKSDDVSEVALSEPRIEVTEANKESIDEDLRKKFDTHEQRGMPKSANLDEVKAIPEEMSLREYLLRAEGAIQDTVDKTRNDDKGNSNPTNIESQRQRADELYRTDEADTRETLRKRILRAKEEQVGRFQEPDEVEDSEIVRKKSKVINRGLKRSRVLIGKRARAEDIVEVGRDHGFTDAHLRMYMKEQKVKVTDPATGTEKWVRQFTDEQIENALVVVLDASSILPNAFANLDGGAPRGKVLWNRIIEELHRWSHTGPRGGRLRRSNKTYSEIRQKAYDLLTNDPIYLWKDPELNSQLQHELLIETDDTKKEAIRRQIRANKNTKATRKSIAYAFDRALGIKTNGNMRKKMRAIRDNLQGMREGQVELRQLQRQLRMFVRQAFPPTIKGTIYTRSQINSIIRRITEATEETIALEVEKLSKIVESARNKEGNRLMKEMFNLFKKRAKLKKSNSNRTINSGVMADDQTFYKHAVNIMRLILKKDRVALNNVEAELESKEDIIADAFDKSTNGLGLTAEEREYMALFDAYHTFKHLLDAELEEVLDSYHIAMQESTEALKRFADWRLKISEQIEAKTEEADIEIEKRWNKLVYLKEGAIKLRRLYSGSRRQQAIDLVQSKMGGDVYESVIVDIDADTVEAGTIDTIDRGQILVSPRVHKITGELLGYDIHVADRALKSESDLSQSDREIRSLLKEARIPEAMSALWERFKRNPAGLMTWFRSFQNVKTMTTMLDYGGSLFTDNIYKPLNAMYEKAMSIKHKNTKALRSMLRNMEIDGKKFRYLIGLDDHLRKKGKVKFTVTIPTTETSREGTKTYDLSYAEMMRLYALSLNEIQRRKLEVSGFGEAEMRRIKDLLGPDVVQFTEAVVTWLSNEHYIQINEVYRKVNNVNLPWVDMYFPTKSDTKAMREGEIVRDEFGGNFNAQYASALKGRTDTTSPIVIQERHGLDFFSVMTEHIDDMSHFMGYAEGVSEMRRFFKIPSVVKVLRATRIGTLLRQSINFSVNPKQTGTLKPSFMNKLQSKFTKLVLGYKFIQILKQATSFVNAFSQYNAFGTPPKTLTESMIKLPFDIIGFAVDTAIVMASFPLQIKKGAEVSATFRERLAQGFEGDMYKLASGTKAYTPLNKRKAVRWERKASAFPTIFGDVLGVLGYMAVYNADIRNGMSQEEAVTRFNNYNETQQSRRGQDMAVLQQNVNFLERVALMFMSTFMLQLNKVMQSSSNILRGKPKPNDVRELILNAGVANVFFTMASNIFKLAWGDDEDKDDVYDEMEKSMAFVKMLGVIPFFGAELEKWIDDYRYDKNTWYKQSGVNPVARLGAKLRQASKVDEDTGQRDPDKIEEAVKELVGLTLGFNTDPWIGLVNYYGLYPDDETKKENLMQILGVTKSYRPSHMLEEQERAGGARYYRNQLRRMNQGKGAMEEEIRTLRSAGLNDQADALLEEYKAKYYSEEYKELYRKAQLELREEKRKELEERRSGQ